MNVIKSFHRLLRSRVPPQRTMVLHGFKDFFPQRRTKPQFSMQQQQRAKEMLDVLATPLDPDHPEYDESKIRKREKLLFANTYTDLKITLMKLGLRKSGDKIEMLTRMLLHIIAPTMNYEDR
jgi:hypothetical protein